MILVKRKYALTHQQYREDCDQDTRKEYFVYVYWTHLSVFN